MDTPEPVVVEIAGSAEDDSSTIYLCAGHAPSVDAP